MSYIRMGVDGSQVYVYMDIDGYLSCGFCSLNGRTSAFHAHSTSEMVDHLNDHIAAGYYVPEDVIPALLDDDAENFGT